MNPDKAISFDVLNEHYKDKKFTIIEGREESFAHHILGVGVKIAMRNMKQRVMSFMCV